MGIDIISVLGFRSGRWVQTVFPFWGSGLVDGYRHFLCLGVQVW